MQSKPAGRPLPYVRQMHADLEWLVGASRSVALEVGSWPLADDMAHDALLRFMGERPLALRSAVESCAFVNSSLDTHGIPDAVASSGLTTCHVCVLCEGTRPSFASAKALGSHMRIKHNRVSPVKRYIGDTGICPHCSTDFVSRVRLLRHLWDSRRAKCRDWVLGGECPPVPLDVFQRLEARDRAIRREALHEGHTHPIARGSARRPNGKRVGHVTQ